MSRKVWYDKFDNKDWNRVEKEVSPFLLKVCSMMEVFGKGTYDPTSIWANDETVVG